MTTDDTSARSARDAAAKAWIPANYIAPVHPEWQRALQVFYAGWDAATAQMGEELYQTKIALDQKEFTLQNTFNHWQQAMAERDAERERSASVLACVKKAISNLRQDIAGIDKSLEDAWERPAKMLDNIEHYLLSLKVTEDELTAAAYDKSAGGAE